MSATPVAGVIAGALTGGLFAGGLHAIAGECRLVGMAYICSIGVF